LQRCAPPHTFRRYRLTSDGCRYGGDFGTKKDLLVFLLKHLPEAGSRALEAMLEDCLGDVKSIKFSFRPYDWSQNAK